jgi:2-polyprenyl-3-methyl-5-hydroxy-6-metoxy-1,4-benzoquinol methylase
MGPNKTVQHNYDKEAERYELFLTTPLGILEKELCELCLKNCSGLKILDLGGGSGLKARETLKAGASIVDVIDISWEMMLQGQKHENSIGRNIINWYQADISKSLDHLPLVSYDMVIANGIFDHAHTVQEYEAMWYNTAAYLKPGGRLITNRNYP